MLVLALGVLISLTIILSMPSAKQHSVLNSSPTGLSRAYNVLEASPVHSINELASLSASSAVLISARTNYSGNLNSLFEFARNGGVIIAYGSPSFVSELVSSLGLRGGLLGRVRDAVFNIGDMNYILANASSCSDLVLGYAYTLQGDLGDIFARSSEYSYVDLNDNGYYDLNEPIGSYPLGLDIRLGNGRVIILFAETLLENAVFDYNLEAIRCLTGGRHVIIDQTEIARDPLELIRLLVYGRKESLTYVVILLIVGLGMVAYIARRA